MIEPRVAIAVSPRSWADRLVRFAADHGGVQVVARPMTGADALAADAQVLIFDDTTSFLSARLVADLHGSGRNVVGVFDPDDDPRGKQHLLELGVLTMVEASALPDEIVESIRTLADISRPPLAQPSSRAVVPSRGRLIAVLGASGGVGTTEIAVELASRSIRGRVRPVLVDLNPMRPAIAARLGLPLYPNLRTAVDAAVHDSGPLRRSVLSGPAGGFEVIGGLPEPSTWAEVRIPEVATLLSDLGAIRDLVIMDAGAEIERLKGPGRFELGRLAVELATAVVLVTAPDPVGVVRAIDRLTELRETHRQPVIVVVNRIRRNRFVKGEVVEELSRLAAAVRPVPDDRRVSMAAWRGSLVASGPFTRAVRGIARMVAQ